MTLMICATGALRLRRCMCGALALDGVCWVYGRLNKAVRIALTGIATTVF